MDATELRQDFLPDLALYGPTGRPMNSRVVERKLKGVVASFERKYSVKLQRVAVKMGPRKLEGELKEGDLLSDGATAGEPLQHGGVDYRPDGRLDSNHFMFSMPVHPVKKVYALGLWFPGMDKAATFPTDWAHVRARSTKLRVYPGKDLNYQIIFTGNAFAHLLPYSGTVPEGWHVSYEAGYSEEELDGEAADIREAVGQLLAIELLIPGSVDKYLAEGLAGKGASVDGLSQNVQLLQNSNALKFQALINAYRENLAAWEKTFYAKKSGVRVISL